MPEPESPAPGGDVNLSDYLSDAAKRDEFVAVLRKLLTDARGGPVHVMDGDVLIGLLWPFPRFLRL